jgi:hypothetical protein
MAPQAPSSRQNGVDLVGSSRHRLVDRCPARHRSACFALGALPAYADGVGTNSDNLTYFIGSIFFTSAAFLQYFETATTNPQLDRPKARRFGQLLEVQYQRIDWWASLVQLIGTLWFNRTTLSALVVGLGASEMHNPVWRPDALGSICFLVLSWFAWGEACHGNFAWRPRELAWWITLLNLVGSIAFGVSAVASYVRPNGSLVSLALTNLGTFTRSHLFPGGRPAPPSGANGIAGGDQYVPRLVSASARNVSGSSYESAPVRYEA